MPRKYSGILRTQCNPKIFRTLKYSKPWHIQNQKHMQNPDIFRSEVYSEPEANSELCQTSTMERCAKIVDNYSCFRKL